MKKRIQNLYLVIKITFILLILTEISLNFVFKYNSKKQNEKATEFIIETKSYEEVSPIIVREIHEELYNLNTQWEQYVHMRLKQFKGKHNTINNSGHRTTLNIKNSTNPIKIFCFGGSTMYGIGARDSHTIPSELFKLIKIKLPNLKFEITNFGCHGYNRNTENIQLQQELIKKNIPDIVIFYDGVNEVIGAHENHKAGTPTNALKRKKEYRISNSYLNKLKLLFSSSAINRFTIYLQRKLLKTIPYETQNIENLSIEIADNYIQNLQISKSLSKQYNFEIINFFQPVLFSKKKLSKYEFIIADKHSYLKKIYLKSYALIQQNKTLPLDTNFFDISSIFDTTSKTIYTDFCHTAEKGNLIVANEIFKHMPLLLKPIEKK